MTDEADTATETPEAEPSLEDTLREQFAAVTAADAAEVVETEQVDETPALTAPEDWPAEVREAFDGFDDAAAKSFLVDNAGKLTEPHRTRAEELGAQAEEFGSLAGLKPVIDAYAPMFQQAGISPAEGFARLAAAQQQLSNPQTSSAALRQIAQSYGIDVAALTAPEGQAPEADDFTDPAVRALQQRFDALQASVTAGQQAQQQREQTAVTNELETQIATFRDATGEGDALAHPHFDKLRDVMSGLMLAGRASDMQTAYDMAAWADPEVRGELVAQEATALAERERAANAERAHAAKAAATKPVTSGRAAPAATGTAAEGETIEDTLRKVAGEVLATQ